MTKIFDNATQAEKLPESIPELKKFLNYNPVHNLYTKKQGFPERDPTVTDRAGWRGYDKVYSKYIGNLREEKLDILEIGILDGYGILAWQRFFINSTVYGVDINYDTTRLQETLKLREDFQVFKKAKLSYFDSTKNDNWLYFYGKKFDIIIDDADHQPKSQINTFNNAWPYLKPGGYYFIEDVGHRYGEKEIQKLSDVICSKQDEIENINVYSHQNYGIKRTIKNIENVTEYIVVIRKKAD